MIFSFTDDKKFWQSVSLSVAAIAFLSQGCAVSAKDSTASKTSETTVISQNTTENTANNNQSLNDLPASGRIKIETGSPADAVRLFYKNLREKRFREALLMTNLRVAVETLTDEEFKDLLPDFERLAVQIPADIPINGEIITNNRAAVTTMLPNEAGRPEIKEVELRREADNWIILMADDQGEAEAKKQGKNYFFNLRIAVRHEEVQFAMEQIAKAQSVYALQNGGKFADLNTLIEQRLLPVDMKTSDSTGYNFTIKPSADQKKYFATAEPVNYGKSGKLSFLLESEGSSQKSRLKAEDKKGASLKK